MKEEGARLGKMRPNGPHKIRDGDPDILPSVEAASLKTNTGASGEKEGHRFGKQMVLREYCVLPPLLHESSLISSSIPRIHRRRHSRVLAMAAATTPNANSAVSSLATTVPVEAVLFDIDGTLCDSDPLHHVAFQEMLLEIGYNNGVPIDDEFFIKNIAGRSDVEAAQNLFPDWELEKGLKFLEEKDAKYRSLANERLEPVKGLAKLVQWVKDHGYKRAAVTNAPRINAELMISLLGLSDFFQAVIVGGECEKPKPAPYPYLKALKELQVSAAHTFVFEDSASGIRAGVAAGMPVVGLATRNPEKSLLDAGATLLIKDYEDPKLRSALEEIDIEEAKLKKGGA